MFRILTKALVFKNDKILLLRRSKHSAFGALKWDLPGGKLEFGETLEDSLIREIKEETKINVKLIKPICTCSSLNDDNTKQYITIVYECEFINGEVNLDFEHDQYKWLKLDEIDYKDTLYYAVNAVEKLKRQP